LNISAYDLQECHFIMMSSDPDTRLVNLSPHQEGSRVRTQNIQLGYDITIQDLPYRLKKKTLPEEWLAIVATIWPDLTEADLDLWQNVGVTFKMERRYSKIVLLYYLPSFFCVVSSWGSFLITPQVVPGRMGLLVTLFLSLTALLVSTITSSPEVSVGVTALAFWVLVHFFFIFGAILVYMLQLALIRMNNYEEGENKKDVDVNTRAWRIDKSMLLLFPSLYILFNSIYWPVCLSPQ